MFRRMWWCLVQPGYNQGTTRANPVGFIKAFRVRILHIYKHNWNAGLQNSPRARFFRSVVNEHQFYNQLDMLDKKSHRIVLARYMASSHRLGVETGCAVQPRLRTQKRGQFLHYTMVCSALCLQRASCTVHCTIMMNSREPSCVITHAVFS